MKIEWFIVVNKVSIKRKYKNQTKRFSIGEYKVRPILKTSRGIAHNFYLQVQ
jgi:hypothetical protein